MGLTHVRVLKTPCISGSNIVSQLSDSDNDVINQTFNSAPENQQFSINETICFVVFFMVKMIKQCFL